MFWNPCLQFFEQPQAIGQTVFHACILDVFTVDPDIDVATGIPSAVVLSIVLWGTLRPSRPP